MVDMSAPGIPPQWARTPRSNPTPIFFNRYELRRPMEWTDRRRHPDIADGALGQDRRPCVIVAPGWPGERAGVAVALDPDAQNPGQGLLRCSGPWTGQ